MILLNFAAKKSSSQKAKIHIMSPLITFSFVSIKGEVPKNFCMRLLGPGAFFC